MDPERRAGRSARPHLPTRILGHGIETRLYEGRRDAITWLGGTVARSHRPAAAAPGRVVAKSIHLQLALEWLVSAFDVEVLVLFRHPANVLASWMEVNLKDGRNSTLETRPDVRHRYVERWGVPLPGPDPVERMCWRIGLLLAALEESAARHPEWHRRGHEHLCEDPDTEFRRLYDELGLTWTTEAGQYLEDKNTPGTGFQLKRVASELSDSWQRAAGGPAPRGAARDPGPLPHHDLDGPGLRTGGGRRALTDRRHRARRPSDGRAVRGPTSCRLRRKCTTWPARPNGVTRATSMPASSAICSNWRGV